MPKPSRRIDARPPPADQWTADLEILPDTPSQDDVDPARLAVLKLTARALASAGITPKCAGRDGTVTLVTLPAPCWTSLARDAWRDMARGGQECRDGNQSRGYHGGGWVAWAPAGDYRGSSRDEAADVFATAVSHGRHCAGFATDTGWLPDDLVQCADNRLALPVLTGRDVGAIARRLCGGHAGPEMPDAEAAVLTPRLLRLARRPGQGAGDYLRKLRDLVAREAVASPSVAVSTSPRDSPTLDRLHGMDEAVAWGMAVARDLVDFGAGRIQWSAVDRGCLISGPPGCGKTMFARALAATCGVPLVLGSYGEWQGSGEAHQGSMLKAMRKTFETARSHPACILFVDEIDSFPNRATIAHRHASYETQVVNALLSEIDGASVHHGVVFVGACNFPEKLDPALVRSGRLDRHVRIGLPDRHALAAILREHLGADLKDDDLSPAALAATGASGADCESLVRGARRRARTADRAIALSDLMDEIGGTDIRSVEQLWIAAVHEAGHAVAACSLWPGRLQMVTLRGDNGGGGFIAMASLPPGLVRLVDLRKQLLLLLAGRAAEQEVFGVASSGAGGGADSDLARATKTLVTASTALGLDEARGLTWRGMPETHLLPATLTTDPVLADSVRVQLDAAYAEARDLVRLQVGAVKALAIALVGRRVLDGPEAEAIVAGSAMVRS